jgi:hypothetical protein
MPASEHSQDKPTGSCGSVTPSFILGTLKYGHEHHRYKLLKASMWNPQATSSRLHASDLAAQGGTACVTGCVCHQAGMSDQACVQLCSASMQSSVHSPHMCCFAASVRPLCSSCSSCFPAAAPTSTPGWTQQSSCLASAPAHLTCLQQVSTLLTPIHLNGSGSQAPAQGG